MTFDKSRPLYAGATYQRAMAQIFDEIIHKTVECYVDDLIVKVVSYEEHLQHLQIVLDRLRQHALKLTPLKCTFMVSSGIPTVSHSTSGNRNQPE